MKTAEQIEKQNHELLLEHVQLEQKCEEVNINLSCHMFWLQSLAQLVNLNIAYAWWVSPYATQVQKEIDKKRETEAILPIERKCSLKAMLLEMQIETMTQRHQKAQVKLWVALAFRQGDKTAAKNLKVQFQPVFKHL